MAELPSATTTLDPTAGPTGAPASYLVVVAAVPDNDDATPRVMSSVAGLIEQHGYNEGAEYVALHFDATKLPVIFIGLPIVTAGSIGRIDKTGNSGSSVISVAAGADGVLAEADIHIEVETGGTIETNGIALLLSMDGGRVQKRVRLGTATSYTVPYFGFVISFAAGTLVAGDVPYTAHASAPRWDQAGLLAARTALAAQNKIARTWLLIGDLAEEDDATDVVEQANLYASANDRFVTARCSVSDRLPQATLSQDIVRKSSSGTITFVDGGGSADTVTRSAGSWIDDGFVAGDRVTFSTPLNVYTATLTSLVAGTLTFPTATVVAEVGIADATVIGTPAITFAEAGAADTITRSRGSWTEDGFRVGDLIVVSGTASNNITATVGIATLTALVMTLGDVADDLVAEVIGARLVTLTAGQTMTAWVSAQDAEYADIDAEPRINLGLGRARKTSPITGYKMRRPWQWANTIRSFSKAIHVPTFRKGDGPHSGWDLEDEDGTTVEFDERIHGGGLAGRFTCARTWGNGPNGTFTALSLTRAEDDTILSRQQNMDVTNLGMSVVQRATENAVGRILRKKPGATVGTFVATEGSLKDLEESVNTDLQIALQSDINGEGPACDSVRWVASRTDDISEAGAVITGVMTITTNGVIEHITTVTRVN
jgi:hypothetical protein